jgi:hypothetical protein
VGHRIRVQPTFMAPLPLGNQSFGNPPLSASKGKGYDRANSRLVKDIVENGDVALSHQQMVEMEDVKCGNQKLADINASVRIAVGLDVHLGGKENVSALKRDGSAKKHGATKNEDKNEKDWRVPSIRVVDLVPAEVKRRTGFRDLPSLLSYVAVVCGGDISLMVDTASKLTWLEEWTIYFEMSYGRSLIRFCDYIKSYDSSVNPVRRVFRAKLALVKAARKRWPMYASYTEDAAFRREEWNGHFDQESGARIVMHDNTNINLPSPSDADLQRALWSDYYGGCVAKGGVALQLCGWIRAIELCTGAIGDSDYIDAVEILKEQKIFAEMDQSSSSGFLNIFDKGYRCVIKAKAEGQQCLQPVFAKSDEQFRAGETLYSGCVAVVRSGNERAVNRCKMSWFLKRGTTDQSWDHAVLADEWLGWGFQVNFMYDKCL